MRHYKYKYGIEIAYSTKIGKGLYIGCFGGIVVNSNAIMGTNINPSHGITIGSFNRGSKEGGAILNNNIYIGPGAKIVGKVNIGYNVAIGANAVVTHDIPANVSVAGVPEKIISQIGANSEYIQNQII